MALVLSFDNKTISVTKHNKHSFLLINCFLCVLIYICFDVETGFHTLYIYIYIYIHFGTYTKAMNYYDLQSMGKWSRMVLVLSFDNKN